MTPERWELLKQLYTSVLKLPVEKRGQFVAQARADDPELGQELEVLLAASEGEADTLDLLFLRLRQLNPTRKQAFQEGDVLLKRFCIVRLLGHGGMGEVYEAEDIRLQGVHVALKTILSDGAGDENLRTRFKREVLLAREVSHPNLCPIYDLFECEEPSPGFLFLTMKLLPGNTLTARLKHANPISSDDGLTILTKVAHGLAAIHAAGIVHRDIKTSNIMLDGTGTDLRLWITDFGLARAYKTETTLTGQGSIAGTPGYLAPELLLGLPPSQASDLFAFGVVMHEVFAGEKPAPTRDGASYVVSPRLASPHVPPSFVKLITGCLSHDPARRCAAFAEALEAIDPKLDGTHYMIRGEKFWTRRRFAGAAVAGVCAMGGGAWWKWDDLENVLHPLPQKRFVALLNWPKTLDAKVAPALTGALAAIKSELSRLESFDHDLLVISPEDVGTRVEQNINLKEVCGALGANLVLAASALGGDDHCMFPLRLLDPASGQSLRERTIDFSLAESTSLPGKAVEAAASLLNLRHYVGAGGKIAGPGTQSTAAFMLFQSAETLVKEPNDAGLESAIDKYKQALELDPRYAIASAKLALAYCRLAAIRHDSSVLDLARRNSQLSLSLNPSLADGHLAMACVLEQTGKQDDALQEIARALSLDPSDPKTLVWQGQIFDRLNRWADAERSYRRVLAERPNYWLAYDELGVALNNQGKYAEALDMFRAACTAAPGYSWAFSNAGAVYLQIGNFPDAEVYLKKSLSLTPNALAASNLSAALRAQGKAPEALPYALKAAELDPADHWNWLELGDCYSALAGHYAAAKSAYAQAASSAEKHLLTDPSDGPAWMQLALYQVKSGSHPNVASLINKAESLGAHDMDSQLCKARILELSGRREDALATLKVCFLKGATRFQISSVLDLRSLQRDSRYQAIVNQSQPGNGIGPN